MIIQPGFLDHWKTRHLVRLLNDPMAPLYVLRFWEHCQLRKTDRFATYSPEILASICNYTGEPNNLWSAFTQTFARLESTFAQDGTENGRMLIAVNFQEINASLFTAWTNGKTNKRSGTHGIPTGYPRDTQRGGELDIERDIDNNPQTPSLFGPDPEPQPKPEPRGFKPPTEDEVVARAAEIGFPEADARAFFFFYESKGWMVGKNQMKSWRGALSGWKIRNPTPAPGLQGVASASHQSPRVMTAHPMAKRAQIENLEARIGSHPANWDWIGFDPAKVTPELKQELADLKMQLYQLRKQ